METTLSDLPEDIIHHHILSLVDDLTNRKALQLGLKLSKHLLAVLQRRPTLVFNTEELRCARVNRLLSDQEYAKRYAGELNYIFSTMDREENTKLDTFTLNVVPKFLDNNLYSQSIELAAKRGLKKLKLTNFAHNLPQTVFQTESLVELQLSYGCRLEPKTSVAWPNLKRLILLDVVIANDFDTIIQGCPSIEYLEVISCRTECIKVSLHNLKKLLFTPYHDQRLEVNATPNLESIFCDTYTGHCIIHFGGTEYPSLRSIKTRSGGIDGRFLTNFARKFPILESLTIIDYT